MASRTSFRAAPSVDAALQQQAETHIGALLEHFDYIGVLALELFQVGDTLLANEMAPRVHQLGHWTIEGGVTSQFENHLRAISTGHSGRRTARGVSVMVNLIGDLPDPAACSQSGAHLHLYAKSPRPGRKVGHITITADDPTSSTPPHPPPRRSLTPPATLSWSHRVGPGDTFRPRNESAGALGASAGQAMAPDSRRLAMRSGASPSRRAPRRCADPARGGREIAPGVRLNRGAGAGAAALGSRRLELRAWSAGDPRLAIVSTGASTRRSHRGSRSTRRASFV